MDWGDLHNLRDRPDYFFAGQNILVVRGDFVCGGICGDLADGGDQYHYSGAGAGCDEEQADGGVRDDVYGRAADRSVDSRRSGQTSGSLAGVTDFWRLRSGGLRGVFE